MRTSFGPSSLHALQGFSCLRISAAVDFGFLLDEGKILLILNDAIESAQDNNRGEEEALLDGVVF